MPNLKEGLQLPHTEIRKTPEQLKLIYEKSLKQNFSENRSSIEWSLAITAYPRNAKVADVI